MKKLKYELTIKLFSKIIKNKILVLQKNNFLPNINNNYVLKKTYTILLAKQLNFTNLISFNQFKFPLSLYCFNDYEAFKLYLKILSNTDKQFSSIVFTKIKSNIIFKNNNLLKIFNSKEIFYTFKNIFNSNILILKTLKFFK